MCMEWSEKRDYMASQCLGRTSIYRNHECMLAPCSQFLGSRHLLLLMSLPPLLALPSPSFHIYSPSPYLENPTRKDNLQIFISCTRTATQPTSKTIHLNLHPYFQILTNTLYLVLTSELMVFFCSLSYLQFTNYPFFFLALP